MRQICPSLPSTVPRSLETPKSPTFLPYSTVPVTQPPAVSLNLGLSKVAESIAVSPLDVSERIPIRLQQLW